MNLRQAPVWALSFADLCIVLLGFFIMLYASSGRQGQIIEGMHQAFGAGSVPRAEVRQIDPTRLFYPGEAVLRGHAAVEMSAIGQRAAMRNARVRVESTGMDPATNRFDGWELAAARTASIARAVKKGGLSGKDIEISIPGIADGSLPRRQRISVEIVTKRGGW